MPNSEPPATKRKSYIPAIIGLALFISSLLIYISFLLISYNPKLLSQIKLGSKTNTPMVLGVNTSNLQPLITVTFDNFTYIVPTNEVIILKPNQTSEINYEQLLKFAPIKFTSNYPSKVNDEKELICNNEYNFQIDNAKFRAIVDEALKDDSEIKLKLADISTDRNSLFIYNQCQHYNIERKKLEPQLKDFLTKTNLSIATVYKYKLDENGSWKWELRESTTFNAALRDYKNLTDIKVNDGLFEIVNGKAYLLEDYSSGKSLDIEATHSLFKEADKILSDAQFTPFKYNEIKPLLLQKNYEIIDFTKVISTGKTRIDLVRDGTQNASIPNAEGGIREVNNEVISPGHEFSYIKSIGRIGNYTKSGYPVGGGTCNSTTTIFRAALEAGFPITERHHHSFLVPSYEWGYEANIVDASYYPDPRLDLKFINDLPYPVLLRVDVTRQGDYQYHTLTVRTNRNAPDRTVKLENFKIFDKYSEKSFSGSFERVITEHGKATRKETFTSTYR